MAQRVAYNVFFGVVRVFFSQECSLILMTYHRPNHKLTAPRKDVPIRCDRFSVNTLDTFRDPPSIKRVSYGGIS